MTLPIAQLQSILAAIFTSGSAVAATQRVAAGAAFGQLATYGSSVLDAEMTTLGLSTASNDAAANILISYAQSNRAI